MFERLAQVREVRRPTNEWRGRTRMARGGLAGVAGVALALIGSVGFNLGSNYIVDAFLVVVVGGFGKLRGAAMAALAIGIVNSYVEYSTSATIGKALVFVLVIGFLQVRPNGIVSLRSRGLTS